MSDDTNNRIMNKIMLALAAVMAMGIAAYYYPSELRHAFCPRLTPCENFFLYSFS